VNQYQTGHLFLLIGSNPLPNAVAAECLATPETTITLLHSKDSFDVAQGMQRWIKSINRREPRLVKINESDPSSIFRGVYGELDEVREESIGLHYTGGTKAMSVHAHRAVEFWSAAQQRQGRNVRPVFSYLNPRKLQMVIDPLDPQSGEDPEYLSVGLEVKLTLKDLLDLHGWELESDSTENPILPNTSLCLATAHSSPDLGNAWREWLRSELFWKAARFEEVQVKCASLNDVRECLAQQPSQPPKRRWLSKGQLKQVSLQWPDTNVLGNVTETMKAEVGGGESLILGDAARVCGYREPEDFCKWLNGLWLESVVLQALQRISRDCELQDVKMNLHLKTGKDGSGGFEFDVVAIRGYQLFAFSCSSDTEGGFLKLKLFEAVNRARQLGGDEARVALVSCSKEPEKVEREIKRDVGAERRICVFGQPHLADLGTRLAEWIREQSKGV
jgi:Card1-like endonuclease family protein